MRPGPSGGDEHEHGTYPDLGERHHRQRPRGQRWFRTVDELTQALIRATVAHGEHAKGNGREYDEQWPGWYAAYMVAAQSGTELPL